MHSDGDDDGDDDVEMEVCHNHHGNELNSLAPA